LPPIPDIKIEPENWFPNKKERKSKKPKHMTKPYDAVNFSIRAGYFPNRIEEDKVKIRELYKFEFIEPQIQSEPNSPINNNNNNNNNNFQNENV